MIPALLVDLALAIALRRRGSAFLLALVGFALMAATLLIFFVWTFPANQLTSNWTQVPPNWAELRRQWEYTHATAAVLTFLALCAVTAASLRGRGTD